MSTFNNQCLSTKIVVHGFEEYLLNKFTRTTFVQKINKRSGCAKRC